MSEPNQIPVEVGVIFELNRRIASLESALEDQHAATDGLHNALTDCREQRDEALATNAQLMKDMLVKDRALRAAMIERDEAKALLNEARTVMESHIPLLHKATAFWSEREFTLENVAAINKARAFIENLRGPNPQSPQSVNEEDKTQNNPHDG